MDNVLEFPGKPPAVPELKLPAVLHEARALILAQKLKALNAAQGASSSDGSVAAMAYAEACGQCVKLIEYAFLSAKRRPSA